MGENSLSTERRKQAVEMFVSCEIEKRLSSKGSTGVNAAYEEMQALQTILNLFKDYA
jgi:hypothetical protein